MLVGPFMTFRLNLYKYHKFGTLDSNDERMHRIAFAIHNVGIKF